MHDAQMRMTKSESDQTVIKSLSHKLDNSNKTLSHFHY